MCANIFGEIWQKITWNFMGKKQKQCLGREMGSGNEFYKQKQHVSTECRSISAKPTGIQKEKDIPRLPGN